MKRTPNRKTKRLRHREPPKIALLIETSNSSARAMLAGIEDFVRAHAGEGIGVADVLRHAPMARRSPEKRMSATIGRSPNEEILRVKLARAQPRLASADLGLGEVAGRCGFAHTEYLSVAFKREVGVPPGEFRRRSGAGL